MTSGFNGLLESRTALICPRTWLVQELLEAEAASHKPIEDEIDEERRKVDAKTPITEEVCILSGVLNGSTIVHCSVYPANSEQCNPPSIIGMHRLRWSCQILYTILS